MELLLSITLFCAFGAAFVLINMVMGAVARPKDSQSRKTRRL